MCFITSFIQCLCTDIRSYLASFLHLQCGQLASLYCYALLGYWYNKENSFLGEYCWLFSSQNLRNYEVLDIDKQLWTVILANKWFSCLPTNWLDKLEEDNGDSIANKAFILYTTSILHTWPHRRAWDTAHEQLTVQQ